MHFSFPKKRLNNHKIPGTAKLTSNTIILERDNDWFHSQQINKVLTQVFQAETFWFPFFSQFIKITHLDQRKASVLMMGTILDCTVEVFT